MSFAPFLFLATSVAVLVGAPSSASALPLNDPRIAINAVNTPGDGEANFIITTPGSYYLDTNLIGEPNKSGIRLESDGVRIDLMGFHLDGASVGKSAILGSSGGSSIAISNGSIANWFSTAIALGTSSNVQVRDLTINSCSGGIALASDSVVERCNLFDFEFFGIAGRDRTTVANCTLRETGFVGIATGEASIVRDCTVSGGTGTGIITSFRSLVTGCTVTQNFAGITGEGGLVADCTVSENTTNGVQLTTGTVRGCEISSNGSLGIFIQAGGRAIGNRIASNGSDGIFAAAGARIEENDVRFHAQGAGIRTFGTGSFVVKNTLTGNGSTLIVPNSGNFVGTLVHANAMNGRNDPWANLHSN